jgi:hypothetical protein
MSRLVRIGIVVAVCGAWAAAAGAAAAQESPSAKATRKKLKQKISVDFPKETRIKEVVDEIRREFDNRLGIKIDNTSGISNNSKVTLVAKDQPLEKILNDLCDRYDMGYYVKSDPKDRNDGWIILRKSKYKERGYEEGKEPKQKSALQPRAPALAAAAEPAALVRTASGGRPVLPPAPRGLR